METITRNEKFIDAASNNSPSGIKPVTRLELFLDKIAGSDVEVPEPVTRIEKYLAKIAGLEVELPPPITRVEKFLAKVAGMDIEPPAPITRIEILLSEWQGGSSWSYDTVTGTSPLSLPSALAHALQSLIQEGAVEQATTPTPSSPVDIVCNNGALRMLNLADMAQSNLDIGYYINNNGVRTGGTSNFYTLGFIAVKPSTAYTMHTSASVNYFNTMEYDASKGFIKRTLYGSAGSPAGDTTTFTTEATTAFIRFGSNIDGSTLDYTKISAITWMLSEGVTAKEFVPYGTLYADGTPEVITLGGKNIIDIATVGIEQGSVASSDGKNSSSTHRVRTVGYVPVEPSTQYTISCVIDGYTSGASRGVFLLEYTSDSASGYTGDTSGWKAPNGYTFTTGATTTYIRVVFAKGSTVSTPIEPSDVSNVQLEYGSAATAYQPYSGEPQTATVVNLFAVGDNADTQDIITGSVTRKCGIWVLTGEENWTVASSNTDVYYLSSGYLPENYGVVSRFTPICSHLEGVLSTVSITAMTENTIKTNNSSKIVYACVGATYATKEAWKEFIAQQYAAGTPVIVLYPLATEQTETVAAQALATVEGDNVISVAAEVKGIKLEATYAKKEA